MSYPPSVIFVCWGNICRSPMAERVARRWLADAGVAARVTSAGVSDEE
ncbi:MAG: low molecular weight phosphotyrosine protein phosphatase, partial [Acidipropionibacterium jensenii]|nr:low molecular weight phosphotyrosine protein phosphatase [Acidipropionibacterium jensenii]